MMGLLGGSYLALIVALLAADLAFTSPQHFYDALRKPEIQYAIRLTLVSCTISALLSIWVATPLGYLKADPAAWRLRVRQPAAGRPGGSFRRRSREDARPRL